MAKDYEVREEYQDSSVQQLLNAPVTCFQGVGDIQSEILEQYFDVKTVKDLANLPHFLEALRVQEFVVDGKDVGEKTVAEAQQQKGVALKIRKEESKRRVSDLMTAPAHLLSEMTPAQDLALYDAFRITNLKHLAQNRIMLEARVISYLAGEGAGGAHGEEGALATILGSREKTSRGTSGIIGRVDEDVTQHVQERINALKSRGRGPAVSDSVSKSRSDSIRELRGRDAGASRSAAIAGGTAASGAAAGRAAEILAQREGKLSGEQAITKSKPAPTATKVAEKEEPVVLPTEESEQQQPPPPELPEERRFPMPAIMAAAVVLLLLLVGLIFMFSGGEEAPEQVATQPPPAESQEEVRPGAPDTSGSGGAGAPQAEGAPQTGSEPGAAQVAATEEQKPPPASPQVETHRVERGENLWGISRSKYNDPFNWPSIYEENRSQITHPDLIHPDQEFRIPASPQYRFPEHPKGYAPRR
ncbi:MAG: hypothetical protein OEZ59_03460 [Deltaproteobacteria bacterium]|nr:hypothetical protein [Deltaproteobacteria bacterium]